MAVKPDIEIARAAKMKPITEIGAELGIPADALFRFGPHKAKLSYDFIEGLHDRPDGKLILVTAVTPTPAGEGKTTTTVGLGDGLGRIGKNAMICIREPSLGPCFGVKGGAAGGGYAQVVPMEDINLHFTGDFHAITAAHNLLAAMVDNHIYWGNELGLDTRRVIYRRVHDMNDRALRSIVASLGGVANGYPREAGFDITAASEVMAILCLANGLSDLQRRIGNIVVGFRRDHSPVTARELDADGAMTVLLKDALMPNIVQTLEHTPAFIHGGPFANIAHGCNTVIATATALKLADYVVTEAGFGADLGAEKFFHIKCRKAGLTPDVVVLVATIRALKSHGPLKSDKATSGPVAALQKGLANLGRHLDNLALFGVPVVVAINRFSSDGEDEIAAVEDFCAARGIEALRAMHWADGGAGAVALAEKVVEHCEKGTAAFTPLYDDAMPLWNKIETIAQQIYGASEITADSKTRAAIRTLQKDYGHFPVCMAKTQYSFSTDPKLKGAPSGHSVEIREVRLSAGAEFIVVITGNIMTMPGLPRTPSAAAIHLDADGLIQGLF